MLIQLQPQHLAIGKLELALFEIEIPVPHIYSFVFVYKDNEIYPNTIFSDLKTFALSS